MSDILHIHIPLAPMYPKNDMTYLTQTVMRNLEHIRCSLSMFAVSFCSVLMLDRSPWRERTR